MATSAITAAQAELISSLSQDEIPIKLRCAICSRLAVNAFRLPCCEQAICESCQSSLPSSCPVCEHTPVSAEDCKPNKSLRTTIKVFLRTEEKKREALRLKEAKNTPPITPVDTVPPPVEAPIPASTIEPEVEAQIDLKKAPAPVAEHTDETSSNPETNNVPSQAEQDIPQPSIEEITPGQEPTEEGDADPAGDISAEVGDGQLAETDADSEMVAGQGVSQTPGFGNFGFDPSVAGGFPAMGMGGDFNQMQMMMAMQNGMAPNAFGTFPMMGMPGMNMDPMAMQNMQNMMMNGGFGGGMGMNMGMGMAGFDAGGTGFNNGWNKQQSWNVGQDNFNQPNAAGMGQGDYPSNNSGYNSHSAGYNQGNYGRGNHYNDYQNNNYGYRGRGRGRGYGRGGYGYGSHEQFSQQMPQQFGSGHQAKGPISETGSIPTGPKASVPAVNTGDVDEFGREIRHNSESKDVAQDLGIDKPQDGNDTNIENAQVEENSLPKDLPTDVDDSTPKPIQTLDEAEASAYQGNANYVASRAGFNSGFQGQGSSFGHIQAPFVKPVDVPINAPTGPKAMREGLSSSRGRGFSIAGRANPTPRVNGSASVAPEPQNSSEKGDKELEKSLPPSREQSRERKRSRSGDRHSHRHRHRSTSLPEDEKETERRRQRRRERRRLQEEGADPDDSIPSFEKPADENTKDDRVVEERSRSASPTDTKRASHRSRRDEDKYRERDRYDRDKYRDRDDERDHKSSHKRRSSRRHHEDRSRSRDREHRHRHSRRASEDLDERASKTDRSIPPTPVDAEDSSRRPSMVTNGAMGIEIKGASSRRKNAAADEIIIPTGPRSERPSARDRDTEKPSRHRDEGDSRHRSSRHRDSDRERDKDRERAKEKERSQAAPASAPPVQDPHTIEREARNRERLLKEAQRIAGLTGGGHKRSRDEGEDLSGRKGRKKRGRAGEENEEARIARLEAERENARWG